MNITILIQKFNKNDTYLYVIRIKHDETKNNKIWFPFALTLKLHCDKLIMSFLIFFLFTKTHNFFFIPKTEVINLIFFFFQLLLQDEYEKSDNSD